MSVKELFDEADRLDESEPQQALAAWRELAASNPTLSVFMRLANCAETLGLNEDAEQAFNKALLIDDRSACALWGLGILAIDHSDYEAAEGYLRRARAIKEDHGILSMLGVAL